MKIKMRTELITNYIKDNHLTKNEFCKRCGISVFSLNRILKQENCKLSTLFKVARTIGISLHQLF